MPQPSDRRLITEEVFEDHETAEAAARLATRRIQPNTVALFGDSISSTTYNGVGSAIYDSALASPYHHAQGYFTWANISLNQKLEKVYTGGVSGNTTTQMLARVTDITSLPVMPGYCVVLGGANDTLNSVGSATIIANLTAIYNAIRAKGITVVACTILPIWRAANAGGDTQRLSQEEANNWIRDYCRTNPDIILCDWAAKWVNPDEGDAKAIYSADGVHPLTVGAGLLGKTLADTLAPYISGSPPALASNNKDATSGTPNAMMSGTGGVLNAGATGSIATNWIAGRSSGAGTIALAKAARTDGIAGEWQEITVAGGGGTFVFYHEKTTGLPAAGERWFAELEFDSAVFTGMTRFVLRVSAVGGGAPGAFSPYQGVSIGQNYPVDITKGVIRTPAFTIPSGITALQTGIDIEATAGSIRISRIRSRKVVV